MLPVIAGIIGYWFGSPEIVVIKKVEKKASLRKLTKKELKEIKERCENETILDTMRNMFY